ncbi:hypothetical protein [Rhodococcoides yunnanense]|uniref:hypothetical protein n=1 Tax=Rhodococcoides yunnanense TaxID=278209 RepID=UPI001FE85963|nr:hypothetical protein [Rhodococcus yunnanensis]
MSTGAATASGVTTAGGTTAGAGIAAGAAGAGVTDAVVVVAGATTVVVDDVVEDSATAVDSSLELHAAAVPTSAIPAAATMTDRITLPPLRDVATLASWLFLVISAPF